MSLCKGLEFTPSPAVGSDRRLVSFVFAQVVPTSPTLSVTVQPRLKLALKHPGKRTAILVRVNEKVVLVKTRYNAIKPFILCRPFRVAGKVDHSLPNVPP